MLFCRRLSSMTEHLLSRLYQWTRWVCGGGTHIWLLKQAHTSKTHDDIIKWKHFLRYWPFGRGIHRSPVNSPHKGQWRRAFMFSFICAWINRWVNNREAGDLRRYRAKNDVIIMGCWGLHDDLEQQKSCSNFVFMYGFRIVRIRSALCIYCVDALLFCDNKQTIWRVLLLGGALLIGTLSCIDMKLKTRVYQQLLSQPMYLNDMIQWTLQPYDSDCVKFHTESSFSFQCWFHGKWDFEIY